MKNKNLLIITSAFPSNIHEYEGIFVREQLLFLKKYFKNIYVIRPQYYVNSKLDILNILPPTWKQKPERQSYQIDNIKVFFPKVSIFQPFKNWQIKKFIIKNNINFDIIHSHFLYPSGEIGNYLKKEFGVKHISTAHGSEVRIPLGGLSGSLKYRLFLKYKLGKILKQVDLVVTNHEEIRDLLISNYRILLKEKLNFFYIGVSSERFNINSKLLRSESISLIDELNLQGKFIVLFIGNLNEFKDPLTFVKAAKKLREDNDIMFLMLGDGELKNDIIKYKNDNNLVNFLYLGLRADTEKFYYISDIFCALSPYENIWSTTIQEAFSMGKPCIVTSSGYTSKILEDYKSALLIPHSDPDVFSKKILELKNNESLINTLSENVYSFSSKYFNEGKNINFLLELYK